MSLDVKACIKSRKLEVGGWVHQYNQPSACPKGRTARGI